MARKCLPMRRQFCLLGYRLPSKHTFQLLGLIAAAASAAVAIGYRFEVQHKWPLRVNLVPLRQARREAQWTVHAGVRSSEAK